MSSIKKYLIYFLTGLAACSSPSETDPSRNDINSEPDSIATTELEENEVVLASDSLIKEVMRIHDEAMAKSGVINSYMTELNELKDEDAQASYVYGELETADDAMMTWMHEIKVTYEGTEEERIAYFESEKIKIENVKTMMLNSIELAKSYLGNEE